MSSLLSASRLIALPKGNGDVRPVDILSMLWLQRREVFKLALEFNQNWFS
jgi:hypothetical protein